MREDEDERQQRIIEQRQPRIGEQALPGLTGADGHMAGADFTLGTADRYIATDRNIFW